MSKYYRIAVSFVMVFCILLTSGAGALAAQNVSYREISCVIDLGDGATEENVIGQQTTYLNAVQYTANDYESLVKIVVAQYLARSSYFEVKYNVSSSKAHEIFDNSSKFYADIYSSDDPETTSDLDYLHWNMKSMSASGSIYNTYSILKFSQTYRTTFSQEEYVNTAVDQILKTLNLYESSQYEKIKAVHDYITKKVTYDNALTKYTAYDALYSGKTVCNGYALLTYKMLLEIGVPIRIIVGDATNSSGEVGLHAWNIVKIGTYWYNLDVTWDDSLNSTKYFLKNEAAFSNHDRDEAYSTQAFYTAYPMSPNNFDLSKDITLINSISFSTAAAQYEAGDTFTLTAAIKPSDATVRILQWTSSDENVAAVDSAGKVTIYREGTALITASATDGSGKSATYAITAYDVLPPSSWAQEGVANLTARGVVPAEINAHYLDSITRAEFTALMVNIYEYTCGVYQLESAATFTDITDSIYAQQIEKGYEIGIINGLSAESFGPELPLTREQCAKIISVTAGIINQELISSSVPLTYGDVASIHSWAMPYVQYATEYGLMQGTGVNFEPLGKLTREQAMVIAERMIEKYSW